jgi:hypothetical protein
MLRWLATIALVAVAAGPVSGQERKDTVLAAARESRQAAAAGLDTLRALAKDHYATLGFTDAEQAAGASLGEPLVEFFVRLDSLQAFSKAKKAASLLSGGDKVMYPVLAGEATLSSIEVERGKGGWRPVAYGGSTLAGAISQQRDQLVATTRRSPGEYFLVRVPALGLVFLAADSAGTLMLSPLLDDPQGRWKAGATLAADSVFSQLVADAKASKGLPM